MSGLLNIGRINDLLWYNGLVGAFDNTISQLEIYQNQIIRILLDKE